MRLHDDIDHITLGWVKPELDLTLRQARHALEAFVESPDDTQLIRSCAAELHMVQGTLRMVELYGAAMVAEEMEHIARALITDAVSDRDEAYAALMRGIVQLPDYLERLQSGHKDIPIVLLPLLNELRAVRGEKALSESVLFSPALDGELPATAAGPSAPLTEQALRQQAEALRAEYQAALLRWLKDDDNPATISALAAVCDRLVGIVHAEPARRLFWVAGGTLEALKARAFEASKPLKQALARVEREIKRLADGGESVFRTDPPLELTRQLLYFVAHAPTDHGRIGEMRQVFRLHRYIASESELEHARGSMAGHNRELLDTVAVAIKEDLLRVKDALDLRLRNEGGSLADLSAQGEVLDRVADTLGMLGLDVPRRVVQEQRAAVAAICAGTRPADESALLDIAGALLYVEASLDDQVARLGQPEEDIQLGHGAPLPGAEAQKLLDALVREAIADLAVIRQSFVAYVETNWDANQLADVPRMLSAIAGALRILELEEAPAYLHGIELFTQRELYEHRRVPDARQLDTLADALTSVEYYLEALRDHRAQRDSILAIARDSLAVLGYWPLSEQEARADAIPQQAPSSREGQLPPADAAVAQAALPESVAPADAASPDVAAIPAGVDETVAAEPLQALEIEGPDESLLSAIPSAAATMAEAHAGEAGGEAVSAHAETVVVEPPVAAPAPAESGFALVVGEGIDDEIREVFLEEFEEEIANLDQWLPSWQKHPENLELLRSIRRVFHTLKGSGRLVGAMALGEFCWKVESLLNRVLEGTRAASPSVVALVMHVRSVLPQLQAALRGEGRVQADLAAIQDVADRLAAGEEVQLPAAADAGIPAASKPLRPEPATGHPESAIPVEATTEPALEDIEPAPDAPVIAVDPVLFEILKAEIAGHLETIHAWLAECRDGPRPVSDPLLRAVHTSNGAFAMTDLPAVTEITSPLESYIKRLMAHAELPRPEGVALVAEVAEAIRRVIVALDRPRPVMPDLGDLPERLSAERDRLPEPTRPTLPMGWQPEEDEAPEGEAMLPMVADLGMPDTLPLPELVAEAATEMDGESASLAAVDLGSASVGEPSADTTADSGAAVSMAEVEATASVAHEAHAGESQLVAATSEDFAGYSAEEATELAAMFAAEAIEAEAIEAETVEAEAIEAEAIEAEAIEAEAIEAETVEAEAVEAEAPLRSDNEDPDLPLDMSGLDVELLDIFLEESADILDHSDGTLAKLRESPGERELVVALQRDLHTLKGGARMAGIHPVGELGHAMESLLEAIAENRRELDGVCLQALERGFDRLHGMVQRVGQRRAVALPSALVADMDALAHSRPLAPQPFAAASPVAEPEKPLPPLSAPLHADALPDEEEVGTARAPQEQVRIRADLLDRLVNYAGEVAIYRARLEQQLGAFRSNLGELDQTTGRLRDQLRKLEIETEAQIIARYQREGDETDASFDPLELDRFSTLQQLSRALAESAADLVSLQDVLEDLTRQHETLLLQQSRVSSDLQEGLMRTRMVPFDALVPRLRRVLRQAAAETGKQVQLRVEGAQGEMDRNVLERMTAPLEHMLRNAVAHGLETPKDRKLAGKAEEGVVRIIVAREGSEVVITVRDDGRGLNAEAIRGKAIERGLLHPDAQVSEQQLYGFILETGFSTAETVSRLAGRGVGMDVVHSEIRQLGGSLQIDSQPRRGTAFTIRLPFTLAVTQAVFVRIGETTYAVPIASVQGVGRIARQELDEQLVGEHPTYGYAGEDYAIHDLGRLLGHTTAKAQESLQMPLLLTRSGDLRAAICVDQVVGSREIVVKPVGPQVSSIQGIFGATVMGDGSVVIILDVVPLVRRQTMGSPAEAMAPAAEVRRVPLVMVVDDSITMRKVTSRVLERHNFEVITAKDGVDAIEKMAERVPDLMLLDIEMPRMDGYELATHMRNDLRLREVPIVMITSRSGDKHRQRAFEIGVNRYLGKPYQEAELMSNVLDLVGQGHAHA